MTKIVCSFNRERMNAVYCCEKVTKVTGFMVFVGAEYFPPTDLFPFRAENIPPLQLYPKGDKGNTENN